MGGRPQAVNWRIRPGAAGRAAPRGLPSPRPQAADRPTGQRVNRQLANLAGRQLARVTGRSLPLRGPRAALPEPAGSAGRQLATYRLAMSAAGCPPTGQSAPVCARPARVARDPAGRPLGAVGSPFAVAPSAAGHPSTGQSAQALAAGASFPGAAPCRSSWPSPQPAGRQLASPPSRGRAAPPARPVSYAPPSNRPALPDPLMGRCYQQI